MSEKRNSSQGERQEALATAIISALSSFAGSGVLWYLHSDCPLCLPYLLSEQWTSVEVSALKLNQFFGTGFLLCG